MKEPPRLVSKETPIHMEDFGRNPFSARPERSLEEAARDMEKSAAQLLADIHDESLAPDSERSREETIARTIARSAAMHFVIQGELQKQAAATDRLNQRISTLTVWGVGIAIVALVLSFLQVLLAAIALCKS
jgi:hypothetical protein